MRVLWFSNTPALGATFISKNARIKETGGWLASLNSEIQDRVELNVAFHHPYRMDSFVFEKSKYHPIYTENIYLGLIKKRLFTQAIDDKYLRQYLKIIDELKPDVIHIHGTENSFLCILNYTRIPILVSIQGNITVYNHKFFSGLNGDYLKRRKVKDFFDFVFGFPSFAKSKSLFAKMSLIEKRRMQDIKYIIGRTSWDERITRILSPRSQYFRGEELLRESFYNHRWDNLYLNNGKLILFTTSGDNYYKGLETIFHSITLLRNIGVDIEWRIAGVNENSLIISIIRSFLSSDFPETGFTLLGSLDDKGLVEEMLKSHIYVMPSHIENSPNNLCEAMILGMPCVSALAGGTGSILQDGEEGLIIQSGDPWAMSGSILQLSQNPELSLKFASNARKRARERHSKRSVVEQYLNIYNYVIKENLDGC